MKRLDFLLLTPLILTLTSCTIADAIFQVPDRITESWQTVTISGMGSFRVPEDWYVAEHDTVLFITDKPRDSGDYDIYLIGVIEGTGIQPHEVLEGVERGDTLLSPGYNNGARVFLVEYIVNGVKQERHLIGFDNVREGGIRDYRLLAWNRDVVDEFIATQIALTYRMNSADFDNPNPGKLAQ